VIRKRLDGRAAGLVAAEINRARAGGVSAGNQQRAVLTEDQTAHTVGVRNHRDAGFLGGTDQNMSTRGIDRTEAIHRTTGVAGQSPDGRRTDLIAAGIVVRGAEVE
jgi:hypothetical protein